ncbi:hypothetical protein FACS1894190_08790 [Spirochaetia bacterium]|nr:hypothetical protein FACS1894190_08790 [Spirochaetia bacterium]
MRRFCFALLFFAAAFGFAQENTGASPDSELPPSDNIITGIQITGLVRTKPHIAAAVLEKFRGKDAANINLKDVNAAIEDTGILDPQSVEIVDSPSGAGKTLSVTVKDKWSFFPAPFGMWNSDGWMVGAAVYEGNAFGINDRAIFAGTYSQNGTWFVMGLYQHKESGKFPGFSVNINFENENMEHKDRGGNVYRRYNINSLRVALGANYPFAENLNAALRVRFYNAWLGAMDNEMLKPDSGRMALEVRQEISWRTKDWDGLLLSERNITAAYNINAALDGSPIVNRLSLHAIWEQPIREGFRFTAKAGVLWMPSSTPLTEADPSTAGVDILPGRFTASGYAGLQAGFENALFRIKYGTVSAMATYQIVYSHSELLGGSFDHGPSAALRFFLRGFAVPAIGVKVSYNINASNFLWTVSMGVEF